MSNILITGGAGFLGASVARALATRQDVDQVIVADIREPHPPIEGAVFVQCDVTSPQSVRDALKEHGVDTVVHLAAIVNTGIDEELEYRVDVEGTSNVLHACVAAGVKHLVVSSSGAAYGYHPDSPDWITEDVPVRGNEEFAYSKHKRLVEEMLAQARIDHPELTQTIFRIGTILGENVDNQITDLWQGNALLAIAGSDSPFVFIWVDDVAGAMVRAATERIPGIYNVAGDGALSVKEIAQRLGKKRIIIPAPVLMVGMRVGKTLKLTIHGPEKLKFLQYRPVLDNTALKQDFGYVPEKTSREAFEAFVASHPGIVKGG